MDGDATKAAADSSVAANAQAVRNAARDNPAGALLEFPEDFETTLGVATSRSAMALTGSIVASPGFRYG